MQESLKISQYKYSLQRQNMSSYREKKEKLLRKTTPVFFQQLIYQSVVINHIKIGDLKPERDSFLIFGF